MDATTTLSTLLRRELAGETGDAQRVLFSRLLNHLATQSRPSSLSSSSSTAETVENLDESIAAGGDPSFAASPSINTTTTSSDSYALASEYDCLVNTPEPSISEATGVTAERVLGPGVAYETDDEDRDLTRLYNGISDATDESAEQDENEESESDDYEDDMAARDLEDNSDIDDSGNPSDLSELDEVAGYALGLSRRRRQSLNHMRMTGRLSRLRLDIAGLRRRLRRAHQVPQSPSSPVPQIEVTGNWTTAAASVPSLRVYNWGLFTSPSTTTSSAAANSPWSYLHQLQLSWQQQQQQQLLLLQQHTQMQQPISIQGRAPAVYTHEYDSAGTRLFTAGGPIASACNGSVAAIWE
ncbi:unnamed protein product [Protopolystoma xenopodis]|uniref:Uncharacterized protein n=1 Tax=Protopolystoma xenopodis TaxID=117903 RepID=A0A448WFD4_9PLAT|nr:unnamed protein product [Protopolystoma xenopodis]